MRHSDSDGKMLINRRTCPFNFIASEQHQTKIDDEEIAVHRRTVSFNEIKI